MALKAGEVLEVEAADGVAVLTLNRPAQRNALSRELMHEVVAPAKEVDSLDELTERERDVLRWVSHGASNKVVAQKLSISPSTVRTHIESVFRKLECSTRAAATLKATHLGLL